MLKRTGSGEVLFESWHVYDHLEPNSFWWCICPLSRCTAEHLWSTENHGSIFNSLSVFKLIDWPCLLQLNYTIHLHPVTATLIKKSNVSISMIPVHLWSSALCSADNLHNVLAVKQLVSMWKVCTYVLHVHVQFLLTSEHPIANAYSVMTWQLWLIWYEIAITFKTSQLLLPITVIL